MKKTADKLCAKKIGFGSSRANDLVENSSRIKLA